MRQTHTILSAAVFLATLAHALRAEDQAPAQPVIGIFAATPGSVSTGAPATLRWNVKGATAISIRDLTADKLLTTSTEASATFGVTPAITSQYELTATSGDLSAVATVTVAIRSPGQMTYAPLIFYGAGNSSVLVLTNTASTDANYQLHINGDPSFRGVVNSGAGTIRAGAQLAFVFPDRLSSDAPWARLIAPIGVEGVVYHRNFTVGQSPTPLPEESLPMRPASRSGLMAFDHTLLFQSRILIRNPGLDPVTVELVLLDEAGNQIAQDRFVIAAGAFRVTEPLPVAYPRSRNIRGLAKLQVVAGTNGQIVMEGSVTNPANFFAVSSRPVLPLAAASGCESACPVQISTFAAQDPAKAGAPVVLTWVAENAESARVSDEDGNLLDESLSGTMSIMPPAAKSMYSYVISATAGNQVVSRQIWVTLVAPATAVQ